MRHALAIVAILILSGALPAQADCYDVFGCSDRNAFRLRDLVGGPTCEFLWTMRNAIYAQHHYCFRTQRGIATFGNEGCRYDKADSVPLSRIERANIDVIGKAEDLKSCPR